MHNRFDPAYAATLRDPLELRVYTSRLLGSESDLVLHGGGNTSVKIGDTLYVKGSGWNLDTIEKGGFAPVHLDSLIHMASFHTLSDSEMVRLQREAMRDAQAPNPSIEAILHAIIPFDFVDHTHADAVVTISNTHNGKERLRTLYGARMLIIDYVMPGFDLAKHVFDRTQGIDWSTLDGIILMHHGVFTFDDDAQAAYGKMIDIVTKAETYLQTHAPLELTCKPKTLDPAWLEALRFKVSQLRGCAVEAVPLSSPALCTLSNHPTLERIVHSGGLTPEHVIRIKPFPALIEHSIEEGIYHFVSAYQHYFDLHAQTHHHRLDPAPRYALIKGFGAVVFGKDAKESAVIADIIEHTALSMLRAEALGGFTSLRPPQLFAMEYWELEQAKLKK
ncbi:MAG: class II aldolase/adducin family protein [Campylobacterales bacterium]|nr:class II aldolase/adducin family protein [Campylobacterales bacterium]